MFSLLVSTDSVQAYNLGLTQSNGYLWLSYAWYPDEWWTEPANRTNYEPVVCPQQVLESMIEHSIIIDHYAYVPDKNSSTDVGIVCTSWSNCMELRPNRLDFCMLYLANFTTDVPS
jgi:hypothetical protein